MRPLGQLFFYLLMVDQIALQCFDNPSHLVVFVHLVFSLLGLVL